MLRDFRYGLRTLLNHPGFAAVAVLTLALGIGANTAIFSVFKGVVLEPFAYPQADRLAHVWRAPVGQRWRTPHSGPDFLDLRERNLTFEEMGVYCPYGFNLGGGEPARVPGVLCSAGVLRALGVAPAQGRWFTEEEATEGSRPVVLSHGAWQQHFGGAGAIVGRAVKLNGETYHVVGVMPENFEFLTPGFRGQAYALWTPFPLQGNPGQLARDERLRESYWMLAIGRLKPGVSQWTAEADLRRIAAQLAETHPRTNARSSVWVEPLLAATLGSTITKLLALMATVGFVLLVACANVASLVLARGARRTTEVAVRVAMGASPRQIVRQMLIESLVLALAGGAVGVLLAQAGLGTLRGLLPAELPRVAGIQLDLGVLAFTGLLTLATTLLFGLAPALVAARTNVNEALKEGAASQASQRSRGRLLRALALAQIAVALLVAYQAVMLLKSLRNVLETPLAFDTQQVLTASVHLPEGEYREPRERVRFWEQLLEKIEALPQVECAAVANQLPLRGGGFRHFQIQGDGTGPRAARRMAAGSYVSPKYFHAMGIRLLSGRALQPGDERLPMQGVVVNRTLAEQCWPSRSALGQRIHDGSVPPAWSAVVVGVAESTRQQGPERLPQPEIYWLYGVNPWPGSQLVVRGAGDPKVLVPAVRRAAGELDSDLPLADVLTMGEVLAQATHGRRFITSLIGLFGGLILTLAMTGVYGLVSYQVAQRTRELGIRQALGASRADVWRLVLGQTLGLTWKGLVVGGVLAVGIAFVIRSAFYGVSMLDPLSFTVGMATVTGAVLMAAVLPAWRAARVEPVQALRSE